MDQEYPNEDGEYPNGDFIDLGSKELQVTPATKVGCLQLALKKSGQVNSIINRLSHINRVEAIELGNSGIHWIKHTQMEMEKDFTDLVSKAHNSSNRKD